jgi:hypothetical protein
VRYVANLGYKGMAENPPNRKERLRGRVRQLILMRETGPKRAGWHQARMRLIWRLHDQIRDEDRSESDPNSSRT